MVDARHTRIHTFSLSLFLANRERGGDGTDDQIRTNTTIGRPTDGRMDGQRADTRAGALMLLLRS